MLGRAKTPEIDVRVGGEQAGSAEPAKISNTETCHASNLEAGGGLQDFGTQQKKARPLDQHQR